MISPELLRRYPSFSQLDDAQLKVIAMLAEEVAGNKEVELFHQDTPGQAVFLLLEGSVDIYCTLGEGQASRDVLVGEINPGEMFGLSALLDPGRMGASARIALPARLLRLDVAKLRAAMAAEPKLACRLMSLVARTALERLHSTRIQLAAARA